MPISAFGILSASMIFVLFAVNVLFFPPALVLYSRYFSGCCACGPCALKNGEEASKGGGGGGGGGGDSTSTVTVTTKLGGKSGDGKRREMGNVVASASASSAAAADVDAEAAVEEMDVGKLRPIEWFYRGPFFRFVASPARYVIFVGFLALLVVGVVLAAQLETPAQQEQWYPSEHMAGPRGGEFTGGGYVMT